MSLILAILVYWIMAVILIAGVVMAVNGSFWLLILGVLGFIVAITKISILPSGH
ncbi:MAG TPA: hypothetical protein VGO67_20045 [Verrucomicrobiae bacterium]